MELYENTPCTVKWVATGDCQSMPYFGKSLVFASVERTNSVDRMHSMAAWRWRRPVNHTNNNDGRQAWQHKQHEKKTKKRSHRTGKQLVLSVHTDFCHNQTHCCPLVSCALQCWQSSVRHGVGDGDSGGRDVEEMLEKSLLPEHFAKGWIRCSTLREKKPVSHSWDPAVGCVPVCWETAKMRLTKP